MANDNTKRAVVIKNLSSNIFEEAIFILKRDSIGINAQDMEEQPAAKKSNVRKDFILKEAQSIINEIMKANNVNPCARPQAFVQKNRFLINLGINLTLVGSIALLIFLAARLF